jgi:preprotein translocase subunit SecG
MYALVMTVHVIVCIFLIIVVLLQSGKAADLAGAFGGMGSQTAFGPRGSATLLSKATTVSAVVFMITSLSLSILATRNAGLGTSVLDTNTAPQRATAPKSVPVQSAPAPAPGQTVPVQVPIEAKPGANPGEVQIDMSHIKVPPPPQQPATPPAGKKK